MRTPLVATFTLFLAGACTTVQPGSLPAIDSDREDAVAVLVAAPAASAAVPAIEPADSAPTPTHAAPDAEPAAAAVPERKDNPPNRTRAKLGVFMPSGDLDDAGVDDGIAAEVAFSRDLIRFFAVEVTVGYIDADGNGVGIQAVPICLNGRAQIPITILDLYGGIGVGALWVVDLEAGPFSDEDFVAMWNGFLGADIGLDALSIGFEAKYMQSEEATDANAEIEGVSLMLTATFGF